MQRIESKSATARGFKRGKANIYSHVVTDHCLKSHPSSSGHPNEPLQALVAQARPLRRHRDASSPAARARVVDQRALGAEHQRNCQHHLYHSDLLPSYPYFERLDRYQQDLAPQKRACSHLSSCLLLLALNRHTFVAARRQGWLMY